MNILLGVTGSVAAKVAHKVIEALESVPNCTEVRVIMSEKACMFRSPEELSRKAGVKVYTERDEWTWKIGDKTEHTYDTGNTVVLPKPEPIITDRWEKGMPVLHIELAKWATCLVIAPATANTIAKMANGICDNLLTCVYAARRHHRKVIIAPAMNEMMFSSRHNQENLDKLLSVGDDILVVPPQTKSLACGDVGVGALAAASDIANVVHGATRWLFPLQPVTMPAGLHKCPGVPVGKHPGAFAAIRKHDRHCGVDLYSAKGMPVSAVEDGTVVSVEPFTGKAAGCDWWLDTKAVKVEGPSGVVCYGEIQPFLSIEVGDWIEKGQELGMVAPVLRPEKHRPDIPGHSCSMLHIQLYEHGILHMKGNDWGRDSEMPKEVLDPTPYLLDAEGAGDLPRLDMPDATI